MRNLMVGLLLVTLAPAACGDSTEDDDDKGNEAGAGGASGEAGGDRGGSSSGGSNSGGTSTGGRGGSSGRGGTSSGDGGDGGDGTTGGMGGEPGGDGGSGGEPSTGGAGMGGTAGAAGVAGGGTGGSAGTIAGAAGVAGGGSGGAGTGGGGTGGTGVCTESPIRCALGTCPSGTSPAFYQASGGPIAIPDDDAANPAVMSIPISAAGLVARLVVQTNITHTYDSDLDLALVTPFGARELSTGNGGSEDDYTNTIFADSGMRVISDGMAPFTGVFRPEQELASLSGVPLAGNYRLSVADDSGGDEGNLASFTLGVCQCLASSGQCEFGLACLNGTDDDGDALIDCLDPNCAASCPKPESACNDSMDNDGDTLVDCADPSCAWACQALGSACTGTNRLFSYATKNVPQVIPAPGASRYAAPIGVDAAGAIVNAAVRFNATHTYDGDLVLTLSSPSGVLRVLTSENGGTGENYVNTVFIDSAAGVIGTTGNDEAPFTGNYRPEEPLSAWTAQPARGIWQGELLDTASGDGGNFTELSLALCLAP